MADECDVAGDYTDRMVAAGISETAKDIAPGLPGVCCECELESLRLINGRCAPCRDKADKLRKLWGY